MNDEQLLSPETFALTTHKMAEGPTFSSIVAARRRRKQRKNHTIQRGTAGSSRVFFGCLRATD